MSGTLGRRQQAQVMGLAAVAMIGMIALLAFVVDAGRFFLIRRELQNTADAAALAGARYLEPGVPLPPGIPASCTGTSWQMVACHYVLLNRGLASGLCNEPVAWDPPTQLGPTHFRGGNSPTIQVIVHCDADYTFGRILNLITRRRISAHAAAALARWNVPPVGPPPVPPDMQDYLAADPFPTTRLVHD